MLSVLSFSDLYMGSSPVLVRAAYQSLSDSNISSDVGLVGPMLTVLAKSDSEIGQRMGICYSFAGT
jgi:hypothetical protein